LIELVVEGQKAQHRKTKTKTKTKSKSKSASAEAAEDLVYALTHNSMTDYFASHTKVLDDKEREDLVNTCMLNRARREVLQKYAEKIDGIMKTCSTLEQMFKQMRPGSRVIKAGVYGVAMLARFIDVPIPVIIKFTVTAEFDNCLVNALLPKQTVCATQDGRRQRDLAWAPAFSPAREQKMNMALEDTKEDLTPHFLFTFWADELHHAGSRPVTLTNVLLNPANKVQGIDLEIRKTLDRNNSTKLPQKRFSVTIMEFGGIPLRTILREGLPRSTPADVVRAVMSSVLCQTMQGMLAMLAMGDFHHNDLHAENVLGCATREPFLYYVVRVHRQTRTFRVPTMGILWRLIDFGGGSSSKWHPQDHGIMARTWFGGPMFVDGVAPEFRAVPLEAFDLARLSGGLLSAADRFGPAQREIAQRMIRGVNSQAAALGKSKVTSIPIKEVGALDDVKANPDPRTLRAYLEDVKTLTKAFTNTGILATVFQDFAAANGYEITGDAKACRDAPKEVTFTLKFL
jgi:hypothetical protein